MIRKNVAPPIHGKQKGKNSSPRVAAAKKRKQQNRQQRNEQDAVTATAQGISVEELRFNRAREMTQIMGKPQPLPEWCSHHGW